MTAAEIVAWSEHQDAMGQRDAIGGRWSDWLVAVRKHDGSCARDRQGHQIFETQAAFKRRQASASAAPVLPLGLTMELFRMTTSTITWTPVSEGLPDAQSTVLLGLSSGFSCEGFLDTDIDGAQIWHDVCAVEITDAVVAWAEMPLFDSRRDMP